MYKAMAQWRKDQKVGAWFLCVFLEQQRSSCLSCMCLSVCVNACVFMTVCPTHWVLFDALPGKHIVCVFHNRTQIDELYQQFDFPELPKLLEVYPHFYHKTVRLK